MPGDEDIPQDLKTDVEKLGRCVRLWYSEFISEFI